LLAAYLLGAGFSLAALFTDLVVAGPLYRSAPYIVGPLPGPLMAPYAGFFWLEVVGDTVGLIIGYRAALFPSLRRQILYLLTPIGLLVLDGILNWAIILSRDTGRIPPELINLLLILAGFLYADAVLRYGSFAGRPVARRDLFYSLLAAAVGLAALYLTVDRWLATYTPFPYPLATGILVVIVAVGFPAASRWLTAWLDKVLFRAEGQQRAIEAAQCALVTGYLARGRRDLARQQVARWRVALEELDVEPSPEIVGLWQKVE
jgi:hypothetical protein